MRDLIRSRGQRDFEKLIFGLVGDHDGAAGEQFVAGKFGSQHLGVAQGLFGVGKTDAGFVRDQRLGDKMKIETRHVDPRSRGVGAAALPKVEMNRNAAPS